MSTAAPPASAPEASPNAEAILVIETDRSLGEALSEQLAADGYHPALAHDEAQARRLADACAPHVLLLGDLGRPRGNLDLLESIRRRRPAATIGQSPAPWPVSVPVIVLSSRRTQPDLLRAFDAGADDYLQRPIQYLELRARLRAVLRRSKQAPKEDLLTIGPLMIDPLRRIATLHGDPLELRRMEFELLARLASDPRRTFKKGELLRTVWGYRASSSTRTVDSHASRLRRKLNVAGESWIVSEWGVGYRLQEAVTPGPERSSRHSPRTLHACS
jgi:DNA-binding response OmpR family regulator